MHLSTTHRLMAQTLHLGGTETETIQNVIPYHVRQPPLWTKLKLQYLIVKMIWPALLNKGSLLCYADRLGVCKCPSVKARHKSNNGGTLWYFSFCSLPVVILGSLFLPEKVESSKTWMEVGQHHPRGK